MTEDNKVSKAQQKAVHKYIKSNYDRIELTVKPKGKKQAIKDHAASNGETLNSFINRAINETILREGGTLLIGSEEIEITVNLLEPDSIDA